MENKRNEVRSVVQNRRSFHVSLINYKKNGEPYRCNIEGFPAFNKEKQLVKFIAFESLDEFIILLVM
jgi:hypothetical protein